MDKVIRQLREIGLSENEAKVYCCLLRKEEFTATEISRCSAVNRSRIYTIIGNLKQKGLCSEKLGKVRKFSAINPEIAFKTLIEREKKQLEKLNQIPKKLAPIFNQNCSNTSPLDFIQVFNTPSSIINKYDTLELNAKKFVYSFCKAPYAMDDSDEINTAQIESMKKNVVYKSIFEVEKNKEWFVHKMQSFEKMGEEIKISYNLPIKLHIFDDQIVMFSMINEINPKENLTYLVIEHKDMANTLIETFEYFWEKSYTIEEYMEKENICKAE